MYKLLLFFFCSLRIAYSEATAQSFDSIAISFTKNARLFESNTVLKQFVAVNGLYTIPETRLARYPMLTKHVLIYPSDLIGADKVLHITAFPDFADRSAYYTIQKINYEEQPESETINNRVNDSVSYNYDANSIIDGVYIRESLESRDSIRFNYRTTDGLEQQLSESYVKYNSFLREQHNLLQSLEADFQNDRATRVQPLITEWLQSFYLAQAEVSNVEYRQFVHWVRDSLAFCRLYDSLPPQEAVQLLKCTKKQRSQLNPAQKDENKALYGFDFHALDKKGTSFYQNESYMPYLDSMYYPAAVRFYKRREFNPTKWIYQSTKTSPTPIFPDTLCWVKEEIRADYESFTHMYFWHPAYDNYPVVGVNEAQMKAYCDWLQRQKNAELSDAPYTIRVELPNLYQYEMSVKYCSSVDRRNTIDTKATTPFIIHRTNNESIVFIQPIYPKILDKSYLNNELYRKLIAWQTANETFPIWNLAGNVSEYCAPLNPELDEDSEQMTVLGGNRLIGLVDPNENQFNTVFYPQTLLSTSGYSTVGFRTVLFLDWKK